MCNVESVRIPAMLSKSVPRSSGGKLNVTLGCALCAGRPSRSRIVLSYSARLSRWMGTVPGSTAAWPLSGEEPPVVVVAPVGCVPVPAPVAPAVPVLPPGSRPPGAPMVPSQPAIGPAATTAHAISPVVHVRTAPFILQPPEIAFARTSYWTLLGSFAQRLALSGRTAHRRSQYDGKVTKFC